MALPIALPTSRPTLLDPPAEYARLRGGPRLVEIRPGQPAYLITTYAQARAVLADARFSADPTRPGFPKLFPQQPPPGPGQMQMYDPPQHTRLRRLVAAEFSQRQVDRYAPEVTSIADELLHRMIDAGSPADLVPAFAVPLPALAICAVLGIPGPDRTAFHDLAAVFTDPAATPQQALQARHEISTYLSELVAHRRRNPSDDLVSRLAARMDTGETDADEVAGLAGFLLVAGHETTTHMLTLGAIALLDSPEAVAGLLAEPAGWPTAIEELLRFLTVAQHGLRRLATVDVDIDGVTIPAGSAVVVALQAANRDPAVFPEPDRLHLERDGGNLAFGHGVHRCIGQELARLELRIGLHRLFATLPRLALAESPLRYALPERAVYGVSHCRVVFA